MGRLKGAKSAAEYFGPGQKANVVQQDHADRSNSHQQQHVQHQQSLPQHQEQQQQSGFRRILSLFKGSQSSQPTEGPSGRAASSFLLAWRSTRPAPDILTSDQGKAPSRSFTGQAVARWESVATDVVSAASKEPTPVQLLQQHALGERERSQNQELAAAERSRQQHALKLQELQRQATLKDRQSAPRLDYKPQTSLGRGCGEGEVLRLASPDGWQSGPLPLTPALSVAPSRGEEPQQSQALRTDAGSSLFEGSRTWLQTQPSRQALILTASPTQPPSTPPMPPPPPSAPSPLLQPPPPSAPSPLLQPSPPQQTQRQNSGHGMVRLPPVAPGIASSGTNLRQQPCGSPRLSLNGIPARLAPLEQSCDPSARDTSPRVSSSNGIPAIGGTLAVAPLITKSFGRQSLGGTAQATPQQPQPSSPASMPLPFVPIRLPSAPQSVQMSMPAAVPSAPLALVSPSSPLGGITARVSPSSPPALEVTLLALTPAQPSSPTMDIILGAGPPKVAPGGIPTGAGAQTPAMIRQRSIRTLTGNGYTSGGDGAAEGLGTPSLTAVVALATGADWRASSVRRVSTPGAGTADRLMSTDDALARRTALLREVASGAGSAPRTVQSLQSLRRSNNGAAIIAEALPTAIAAAAATATATVMAPQSDDAGKGATMPAEASAAGEVDVPPLVRSYSQQRVPSPPNTVQAAERSHWDYWKNRSQESNWGLWKSQSNLSSRVRNDLEKRAMEEAVTAAAAATQPDGDSGAESPVTGGGGGGGGGGRAASGSSSNGTTTPRWKQMLEATAAMLGAAHPRAQGSNQSADSAVRSGSPGTSLPRATCITTLAAATATGYGSGDGSGSDRSYDGTTPSRVVTRAATMRPRPGTPAAKTGRVLLRAASQPATEIFRTSALGHPSDGVDGKRSSGDQSEGVKHSEAITHMASPGIPKS
ncbi:hypothetical protein Vretifemale_3797, partial [Volvox reticuliferus]